MKKISLLLLAVAFASAQSRGDPFLSEVVNLSGQNGWQPVGDPSGSLGPIDLYLPAGNYTATPVEPPFPGAEYQAHSYWSTGIAWSSEFNVALASDPNDRLISEASNGISNISWVSSAQAFEIAAEWGGGTFSLLYPQDVLFSIGDSYYPDNLGGVSFDLVGTAAAATPPATPEPASFFLLGTALVLLAALKRRHLT